jgi:glucan phosphorylase
MVSQDPPNRIYVDIEAWMSHPILNAANMGLFFSYRTVLKSAEGIWE